MYNIYFVTYITYTRVIFAGKNIYQGKFMNTSFFFQQFIKLYTLILFIILTKSISFKQIL